MDFKNRQVYLYYGILSLCLLLSGILFWRAFIPSYRTWRNLKREIQSKEKVLQTRRQEISRNMQLREEILAIEKTYGDFNQIFFPLRDIPEAVKTISDISGDLEIEFVSLIPVASQKLENPSKDEPGFSLWKTPISIKIKTSYLKLVEFLKRIEKSKKFIKIENLRIKKNLSNLLVHDMEMTVYVLSLQQEK